MTAGKGIVHAEMPLGDKVATGLQLWVNLPKSAKMVPPRYQELLDKDVPRAQTEDGGVVVKVIAGDSLGVSAKVHTYTPIYYLDVKMEKGQVFEQVCLFSIPHNATCHQQHILRLRTFPQTTPASSIPSPEPPALVPTP